ncbi:MAG: ABC transporter ATP-binding protein [Desulfobacteraceae bacterium]|nr:ABC transporter ATP-binding protein [Desulfobacteraceae bacterium]
MLKVSRVTKRFGGLAALENVSFHVAENELLGVIGPNGSGKTTLINLINGIHKPDNGEIFFRDKRIDRLSSYKIAKKGIGRTFQVTRIFRRMSVMENMMVPALSISKSANPAELLRKALDILGLLKIVHLKDEYGRSLSGGQHKLLELGRVLMLDPDLILLDEPFAGVHPELKEELHDHIRKLHDQGRTFVLISHDMHSIFSLSQRLMVLSSGKKIAHGTPEEIKSNEEVIEAYLGN